MKGIGAEGAEAVFVAIIQLKIRSGSQIQILSMQRKRSKSLKKTAKKKPAIKKDDCSVCDAQLDVSTLMQHALYRKYSNKHYPDLELIDKLIAKPKAKPEEGQFMEKYYKSLQRKHQFIQIKEIYKLHTQSPRLFLPEIRDILTKCQHRKRLLQYFKIAKILGLKVESVKFSTFLFSVSKSINPNLQKQSYDRIIGHISGYEFSEQIQKQLLDTLGGKPNERDDQSPPFKRQQNYERKPNLFLASPEKEPSLKADKTFNTNSKCLKKDKNLQDKKIKQKTTSKLEAGNMTKPVSLRIPLKKLSSGHKREQNSGSNTAKKVPNFSRPGSRTTRLACERE